MHSLAKTVCCADKYGILEISAVDAPLVSPGDRALLNFDNAILAQDGGMHFCLCNNVWGTNFVMWFEDDMQFRFTLAC